MTDKKVTIIAIIIGVIIGMGLVYKIKVVDTLSQLQVVAEKIKTNTSLAATRVEDCRSLPMGEAPCGGPSFYHVYSTVGSNVELLEELASEYQRLEKRLNYEEGAGGICVITPEPTLVIVDGNCAALDPRSPHMRGL